MTETVHACPPGLSGVTPCCGRTPFELPRTDRMTTDPQAVTCTDAPTPGLTQCPTCGPKPTEPHPRQAGVDRCANCKTHVAAEAAEAGCGATVDCEHPDDEHSVYGCADGCACEWMPKQAAPIRRVPRLAGPVAEGRHGPTPEEITAACTGTDGFCDVHGFHRHAPAPDGLRDQVAEALMAWAERNNAPQYAAMRRPDTVRQNAYSRADAVMRVRDEELLRLRAETATADETARRLLERHQELAAERYAWQERGLKAEATIDRMKRTNRMLNGSAREARERAEKAEATVERVRAECDRIEAAVRANPQDPDFDGAYLATLGHIRAALTPEDPS